MKSLHRALEIDPAYSFAANKLFDHYMDKKNYDKAGFDNNGVLCILMQC